MFMWSSWPCTADPSEDVNLMFGDAAREDSDIECKSAPLLKEEVKKFISYGKTHTKNDIDVPRI